MRKRTGSNVKKYLAIATVYLLHMVASAMEIISDGTAAAVADKSSDHAPPVSAIATSFRFIEEEWTIVDGFKPQGTWYWSSVCTSPLRTHPGTIWSAHVGDEVVYDPGISSVAKVQIYIHKLMQGARESSDNKVKYEIHHAGNVSVFYLDCSEGDSGWVNAGVYEFAGTGSEIVKLVKQTPQTYTRASAIAFEIVEPEIKKGMLASKRVIPADKIKPRCDMNGTSYYDDIHDDPYRKEILWIADNDIFSGIADDALFLPERLVTREEYVTLAYRAYALRRIHPVAYEHQDADAYCRSNNMYQGVFTDGCIMAEHITTGEALSLLFNFVKGLNRNSEHVPIMLNDSSINVRDVMLPDDNVLRILSCYNITGLTATDAPELSEGVTRSSAAALLYRFIKNAVHVGPPPDQEWRLTFFDDFSGTELDWELWESAAGPYSHILSSRWPENIEVGDGVLRLVARKESRGGQEWTAGHIWTKDFSQTYGYWECRYKYAPATGLNQSWWVFLPNVFEIDINEGHYPNRVNMSLHAVKPTYTHDHKVYDHHEDLSEDFHIYAAEWNEKEIIYYLNGKEIGRFQSRNAQEKAKAYLSLAVAHFAGPVTDQTHNQAMEVDWVRIYESISVDQGGIQ